MIINAAARIVAGFSRKRFDRWYSKATDIQENLFKHLLENGRKTRFGKEHGFDGIKDYDSFREKVPVRDYEGLSRYIDMIRAGEEDVLWPGKPLYLSKTSGTTSGVKYIPISRESMPYHVSSARNALLMYILKTGCTDFLKGRMIFVSGSPELDMAGEIPTGRLSGISHRHIPAYLRSRRLPSYEANCIPEWDKKLDAIVRETADKNMSLISGIPPWVEMYFERLLDFTGKSSISELFPAFSLFVYGGVNFEPYQKKFFQLIGRDTPSLETFPASEGFIGFQDEWPSEGLLLIPEAGVFYEFIPADEFFDENPQRVALSGIETGVNYVMILNTNAGLWGYNIGDTVRFVSKDPYRFVSTGRLSHFTSAFGEHIIAEEAEHAVTFAAAKTSSVVTEFTLAPLVDNPSGLPCHQWFIEFNREPEDKALFARTIDKTLQEKNPYYSDLVSGQILKPAEVYRLDKGAFNRYMESIGKLGGQNKVPHLSNDRKIAGWFIENEKMTLLT